MFYKSGFLRAFASLLAATHLLTACSPAQTPPASMPTPGELQVAVGDVIEVEVWREEDLSGEFLVNEAGFVTLPLLGDRQAAGVPIGELRTRLVEEYREQLQNPSIVITPLRRVYVLGEVQAPGLYTVDPTVSLAGAIAMAEGATSQGDLSRIRIIRNGVVIREGIGPNVALHDGSILSGDQIIVGERSWFVRNSTFVVSVMLSVSSIAISLLR